MKLTETQMQKQIEGYERLVTKQDKEIKELRQQVRTMCYQVNDANSKIAGHINDLRSRDIEVARLQNKLTAMQGRINLMLDLRHSEDTTPPEARMRAEADTAEMFRMMEDIRSINTELCKKSINQDEYDRCVGIISSITKKTS